MEQLIEALQIMLKYGNPRNPFAAEHDVINVWGLDFKAITEQDKTRLEELGFNLVLEDDENNEYGEDYIYSFRYGSC